MTTHFSRSISTPATTLLLAVFSVIALSFLVACHSKQKSTEAIPPIGYFATSAEAQRDADRENADLARTRVAEKSAGVSEKNLPCGKYKVITRHDSDGHPWFATERDMTGCPNPALAPLSQPHPTGGQR